MYNEINKIVYVFKIIFEYICEYIYLGLLMEKEFVSDF